MPVRFLNEPVMRWPGRAEVDRAVRSWAESLAARAHGVLRVGYFGSYARGDWGVGSDVDLVVIVGASPLPRGARAPELDPDVLPVHADLMSYTEEEWLALQASGSRLARTLASETVWVYERAPR